MPHIEQLEGRTLLSVPSGFADTTISSALDAPTAFAFTPDGRLFINEQGGTMRVVKNGQLLDTPALQLTVDSDGERGLLGIAFDPHFAKNHFVYVYYTSDSPQPHNRVSRFTVAGDTVDPSSEQVIFNLPNLSDATNHNGGGIHFGPDGKLYIGVGENAHPANSQSLHTVLGKILRINSDGSIPTDNPFFRRTTGINRAIWARGLRNPYTFAFKKGTKTMYINDVGQDNWEEIDKGRAGANYGWPKSEGPRNDANFDKPLYFYSHAHGVAITGATFLVSKTTNFPSSFKGQYFFGDYGEGFIHRYNPKTKKVSGFAKGLGSPVDLAVGPDGALYYLSQDGTVGKIDFVGRHRRVQTPAPVPFSTRPILDPPANVTHDNIVAEADVNVLQ